MLCGPVLMLEAATDALRSEGVPARSISFEKCGMLFPLDTPMPAFLLSRWIHLPWHLPSASRFS
jgi:hypothetical protein